METLVVVLHMLFCLIVVGLVLIQDPKGGSVGLFGSGGANSVLGATGATTLAQKMTRLFGVLFGVTSLVLSYFFVSGRGSVVDKIAVPAAAAPVASPVPVGAPVSPSSNPETPPTSPAAATPEAAPTPAK